MNNEFEFKSGDIVNYYPYGDREFELRNNEGVEIYSLCMSTPGIPITSFTTSGMIFKDQVVSSLKLVRRPSEKVTWHQVIYLLKEVSNPWIATILYEDKKSFIEANKYHESDFRWIKLIEVVTA